MCYQEAEPLLGTEGKFLHLSSALKGPDSFWDEGSNALWVSVVAWGRGREKQADRVWLETFVFIFGVQLFISPKVWIRLKKVGWGGEEAHLLTQDQVQSKELLVGGWVDFRKNKEVQTAAEKRKPSPWTATVLAPSL